MHTEPTTTVTTEPAESADRPTRRLGLIRLLVVSVAAFLAFSATTATPASAAGIMNAQTSCDRGILIFNAQAHDSNARNPQGSPVSRSSWLAARYHVYYWTGSAWSYAGATEWKVQRTPDHPSKFETTAISPLGGYYIHTIADVHYWNDAKGAWGPLERQAANHTGTGAGGNGSYCYS